MPIGATCFATVNWEDVAKKCIVDFTSLFHEALPFVVLGAALGGVLQEFLPSRVLARMLPRSRVLGILIGGLLGLIFPMCECGIIPLMRRLLRKGLPLSSCMAYLLAGPIINVVVILSTLVAFTGSGQQDQIGVRANQMNAIWMTCMRMALGYLVAVGTALIVEWQQRKHGNAALLLPIATTEAEIDVPEPFADAKEHINHGEHQHHEHVQVKETGTQLGGGSPALTTTAPTTAPATAPAAAAAAPVKKKTWLQRMGNVSETALHDFIDIAVFLILGAFVASLVRQFVAQEQIAEWSSGQPLVAIALMMAFAFVVTLCSEADAFIAASFQTLRPAAKLAFLVLGPMLDVKLFLMYTRVFRRRFMYIVIGSVVSQVFLWSVLTHYVWENYGENLRKLFGG
jgi:uncharacterized membrane protein YraQ (UPF0718 family)